MKHVGILTLGQVELQDDLLSRQHQPIIMLAYLAHGGRRDREHLAHLFWPTAKKPLNNLSSTLTRIRQEAPDALDVGTHQIACNWTTDASQMLALIEDGRVGEALGLYTGPFLDGFRLRTLGHELEEWIYETRDTIAATVANAAIEASRALVDAGQWSTAADMAEQAVAAGGLSQIVLDNLDHLYALLAGSSRLAAQKLRTDAESIGYALDDVELLRPPPEAESLQHRDGFIGRTAELAEITAAARPGQVVNVYGLGGSGKSSLAKRFVNQAVQRLNSFPGGCHVVSLDAATEGEQLVDAIAGVLKPQAASGLVDEIASEINQRTLLVIDDVIPNREIIAVLKDLHSIDLLSCVVLSRIRIDAPMIEPIAVRGLSTLHGAGRSQAAELFIQQAGQRLEIDEPGGPVSDAVEDICQRVSGLPLAIELTAAWLRMLPVFEIPPLFDDGELLHQAPPGENLSLGLVIRRTWDMLDPAEQRALSGLSIMRGGFTRVAAREVASTGLGDLTKLHDYSLIDVAETGRMTLHPLILDFATQSLAEDHERQADLASEHRQHFLARLDQTIGELNAADQGKKMRALREDHRNVDAAWEQVVSAGDWQRADRSLDALHSYLMQSGQLIDARRLYELAFDAFASALADVADAQSLLARLTNNLAWVQMLAGKDTVASRLAEEGLHVVPESDRRTRIALLRTKCAILGNNGDVAGALEGYLVARDLADELGDDRTRALLHEDIGRCYGSLGDTESAAAIFRDTLDSARERGDIQTEARSYLLLGAATAQKDPTHALVLFDEGVALATTHDLSHLLGYFPKYRGYTMLALGEPEQAAKHFEEGIRRAEELGDQLMRLDSVAGLTRARLIAGDRAATNELLREASRTAIRAHVWPQMLGIGLALARAVLAERPEDELAAQVFHFCTEHELVLDEDLVREPNPGCPSPTRPFSESSRLDETCERLLQLSRTLL